MFSIFNLKTNKTLSNLDSSNSKPSEISSIQIIENNEDNDPAVVCHIQNEQNCSSENENDLGDINSGPARPKLQV